MFNLKKLMTAAVAVVMSVSAIGVCAYADEPERVMSPNATVETITYDDGSEITVHTNEGFTIEVEDREVDVMELAAVSVSYMATKVGNLAYALNGTDLYKDIFDTSTADVLYSQRKYIPNTTNLTAGVQTNSTQTIEVDVIQYNPSSGASSYVGYVTFSSYKGTKNLRVSGVSSSYQYYYRVTRTDGNTGTGYIEVS